MRTARGLKRPRHFLHIHIHGYGHIRWTQLPCILSLAPLDSSNPDQPATLGHRKAPLSPAVLTLKRKSKDSPLGAWDWCLLGTSQRLLNPQVLLSPPLLRTCPQRQQGHSYTSLSCTGLRTESEALMEIRTSYLLFFGK